MEMAAVRHYPRVTKNIGIKVILTKIILFVSQMCTGSAHKSQHIKADATVSEKQL